MVMYKIDRRGGVQKSFTRTDPMIKDEIKTATTTLCPPSELIEYL